MYCENCGKQISGNARFSKVYGAEQLGKKIPAERDPYNTEKPADDTPETGRPGGIGHSRATAGLVLGIVSVAFFVLGLSPVSIACGIIGVCCASASKRYGFAGRARSAGFVLSLLGVILGGLKLIYSVIVLVAHSASSGWIFSLFF